MLKDILTASLYSVGCVPSCRDLLLVDLSNGDKGSSDILPGTLSAIFQPRVVVFDRCRPSVLHNNMQVEQLTCDDFTLGLSLGRHSNQSYSQVPSEALLKANVFVVPPSVCIPQTQRIIAGRRRYQAVLFHPIIDVLLALCSTCRLPTSNRQLLSIGVSYWSH